VWGVGPHLRAVAAVRCSGGQPGPGDAGSGGSSPDNAGTGQYCQMARVRQARQRGVTQVNQWLNPRKTRTGSKPGGSGPGSSARPPLAMRLATPSASNLVALGGREESLWRTRGDAVGAQLGAHPVKRFTVNMGTAITLPAANRAVRSRESSSSADGVVAGRSPRSSRGSHDPPRRAGKPSTGRRGAASSQGGIGMPGGRR
jgi:hypothetical protein